MNCKVCENTSAKNPSVSYFRFPRQIKKCRNWAARCDLMDLFAKHGASKFYKSFRICSDHFDSKDILFDGRKKRLLEFAIPEIKRNKSNTNSREEEEVKLVDKLCRLCATGDGDLTEIFGSGGKVLNLEDKLKYIPLIINKCDGLPLKICHQCIRKLNQFNDFISNCFKAETRLKVILNLETSDKTLNSVNNQTLTNVSKTSSCNNTSSKVNDSTNLCFIEKTDSGYVINCDKILQDDFLNTNDENDYCTQPQAQTVYLSRSVNFEQDYPNLMAGDQLLSSSEIQTDNGQNYIEKTTNYCNICFQSFSSVEMLKAHSLIHLESNEKVLKNTCEGIPCKSSSEEIKSTTKSVPESDEMVEPAFILKCRFCDKPFNHFQLRSNHEKTHTGKTPYECSQCGKKFRTRASLRQHKSVHSNVRSHHCKECGMSFKRKTILVTHLRIHTGERPFICQICGLTFKQRSDCIKHEKNHEKKKKKLLLEEMEEAEAVKATKAVSTVPSDLTIPTLVISEEFAELQDIIMNGEIISFIPS